MLASTRDIIGIAEEKGIAVGSFNVYNLEGVVAVIRSSEQEKLPVILQIAPVSLESVGSALVALTLAMAEDSTVPTSVHLDHCPQHDQIDRVVSMGLRSVMADGSHLSYEENIDFTFNVVNKMRSFGGFVEGELGRLTGTEDGLTIPEYESLLTDPDQAADYCDKTDIDALAVCVGNIHGKYIQEPKLDFDRLSTIRDSVSVPLVLHGASGLPEWMISRAIDLGVRKFNVNTEVRTAFLESVSSGVGDKTLDLARVMEISIDSMSQVVTSKIRQFSGR
ncbi:MAG: class II fructose-bisphosphate aldolase [Chloroflexota bacterium]|nr:class II fructose-bisphosphate aldolase [Chloroflexota bacterium]